MPTTHCLLLQDYDDRTVSVPQEAYKKLSGMHLSFAWRFDEVASNFYLSFVARWECRLSEAVLGRQKTLPRCHPILQGKGILMDRVAGS